jgi:serine/threonine-protein kinase
MSGRERLTSGNGHAMQPARVVCEFGLQPGDCILNTYRIERLISTGGMGALYAGRHEIMGDPVAIKVILSEFVRDELAVRLFQREAAMLKQVRHDAVVRYEAFLKEAHGGLVLVMEYVDGQSLSARLAAGRLPLNDLLLLGGRLASGLQAAHDAGIAHRDLSPDNVLLPANRIDQAKIIDFGIAKQLGHEDKTILGQRFAGKIRYASPEQLGLFGGVVDHRSDIYSLALTIAEAAGLHVPGGNSVASALEVRSLDAELPSDLDLRLRKRLMPMLRADPAARPSSVLAAWELPDDATEAKPARQAPTDDERSLASIATFRGSHRRRIAAGALLGAVLVGGPATLFLYKEAETALDPRADAKQILELPEAGALQRSRELIEAGGNANLDTAFGVLLSLARGGSGEAALMVAKMYDPVEHAVSVSPVSPNPTVAAKWYRLAAEKGIDEARTRLTEFGAQ